MATEENKKLAHLVLAAFGGKPLVFDYLDDSEKLSVDILSCVDRPFPGVTSYSTLGLSDFPMFQEGREFHVRLELLGGCDTKVEWFPNMLASAALRDADRLALPSGLCFAECHSSLRSQFGGPAYVFSAPFLWEEKLKQFN